MFGQLEPDGPIMLARDASSEPKPLGCSLVMTLLRFNLLSVRLHVSFRILYFVHAWGYHAFVLASVEMVGLLFVKWFLLMISAILKRFCVKWHVQCTCLWMNDWIISFHTILVYHDMHTHTHTCIILCCQSIKINK